MTRHFIPPEAFARRAARIDAEFAQRAARRLQALGKRIANAKAKPRPGAAGTRLAMEQAMKALRP